MSQPTIPLELQQLIIDVIGHEFATAQLPPRGLKDGVVRDTWQACSLVCKDWHSQTLRNTFYNTKFAFFNGYRDLKRHAELFRILELNPAIRRCIRRTEIYMGRGVQPEHVETLCNAISPIETLRVVLETSRGELNLPRPSPFDGLYPILTTPHLRDFSICSTRFPLCLLENLTSLRSLTLEGVGVLDTESSRDRPWRSESSTLEKLVVARGRQALTQVGAAAERNVGLYAFFKKVKYLDTDLFGDESLRDSPWRVLLARWIHLETLVFRWAIITMGKFISIGTFSSPADAKRLHSLIENGLKLFEICQIIPWESFQGLRSMTYDITFKMQQPRRLLEGEVDPSKTIFSGPSRLPQLQDLHVVYHNPTPFTSAKNLCAPLDVIYLHNLNKTIEDPSSFPSLRTFYTELNCTVSHDAPFVVNEEQFVQHVMDRLPAIFCMGGQRETHGWVTTIVPRVKVVYWF